MSTHGGSVSSVTPLNVANPGVSPGSVVVNSGTFIQLVNNSDFPELEMHFTGASPTNQGNNFVATKGHPVFIHVNGPVGDFPYDLRYKVSGGGVSQVKGPFPFSVRSCGACT
jgi:hypothetical protein